VRGPRAASVVLVRGVESGRIWLRWSDGTGDPLERTLEPDSSFGALPAEVSPALRQALLALARATNESVMESRLQSLWEAIEFYVAGTKGPKLFSQDEIDKLIDSMPSDLTADQAHKLETTIRGLNMPALGVRLRWRLDQDGVQLSDDEHALLFKKLREARNDLTHGRPIRKLPTREEMHRGVSIVARMLVERVITLADAPAASGHSN